MIIFAKKQHTMESGAVKVQTGLRLSPALISRLKRNAKSKDMSFNGYVEDLLESEVFPSMPKLKREDFQPDEQILRLGKTIPAFTEEEITNDPKLAYILSK